MHARPVAAWAAWTLLGATALAGCSLLVNQGASQCSVDGDCARFAGTHCVRGGCVAPLDGGLDLTLDPGSPCTSTQDCLALRGSNWVCRASSCQALGSKDCGIVLGNYTADDVLLLGAILPIYGAHKSAGLPIERGLAFAADQDFSGGVPFGHGTQRHPVAVVLCDESRDPVGAALHLARDVRVPVILGPSSSDAFLAVAQAVAIPPRPVLVVSPYATADWSFPTGDGGTAGLLWRTAPACDGEASAMAQAVTQVFAPRIDAANGTAPVTVAVVWRQDTDGETLHDRLLASLAFNGLPATAEANEPFFTDATYGNPDVPGANLSNTAVTTITGASPLPALVVVLGGTEAATGIVQGIEEVWPAAATRPYYLLSHGLQVEELLGLVKTMPGLASRTLVASPGDDAQTNGALRELYVRYRALYADYPAETFGMPQAFDAYYLLAYGLAGVRNTDVAGLDLLAGLQKVLYGEGVAQAVSIGPEGIATAFAAIDAGRPVALAGTSGPLRFDGGTPTADVQMWCITAGSAGATFTASGLAWRASSSTLGGSLDPACLR